MLRDRTQEKAEPADICLVVRDGSPEPACSVVFALVPYVLIGLRRKTADRGGRSRTDDNPSRTARPVRSVPRVDH